MRFLPTLALLTPLALLSCPLVSLLRSQVVTTLTLATAAAVAVDVVKVKVTRAFNTRAVAAAADAAALPRLSVGAPRRGCRAHSALRFALQTLSAERRAFL